MYQGEKEEKERLELEEKREKVIPPALRLVQQARLDTYSPARRRVARTIRGQTILKATLVDMHVALVIGASPRCLPPGSHARPPPVPTAAHSSPVIDISQQPSSWLEAREQLVADSIKGDFQIAPSQASLHTPAHQHQG